MQQTPAFESLTKEIQMSREYEITANSLSIVMREGQGELHRQVLLFLERDGLLKEVF